MGANASTLDRNVPVEHSAVIVARCPAGQRHVVEGAGHLMFEQLDQIIASVLPSRPEPAGAV